MKLLKIFIVMLILIMSVGAVCAADSITDDVMGADSNEILETVQENIASDVNQDILKTAQNDIFTAGDDSFTNLTDEIEHNDVVDLTHDYRFNNQTDDSRGILIGKDNFILNGNGRTIDAGNQSRIFNITAKNVTLSNLILMGGNAKEGGAIYSTATLTLKNVTFTNNFATDKGGAIALYNNVTLNCDDIRFIDNYAGAGSAVYVDKGSLNLYNSRITSSVFSKRGQIVLKKSKINIENTTFINIASSYTPAVYVEDAKEARIINSRFINLMANITAGAVGIKGTEYVYIKGCEFINTTSSKNAGAVIADIAGDRDTNGSVEVLDTIFRNTYSGFGGAYMQLGGNLVMNNVEFTNARAKYNGGAVYLSYTDSEIRNCNFTSNGVELNDLDYPTYGGAIFSDISTLRVDKSRFINNTATAANAIYAYDTAYAITNSLFENNTNPIYTFFDKESLLENNVFINDDNISTNNELHATIQVGQGVQLTLLNNTINITTIPASFDLRNYSWVTPVRDQGWMGACWTFGMTSALESALLKATGISADFSENNMQNTMLKYSIYGHPMLTEGGANTIAASYLLSWLGAFPQEADTYDELGKVSPLITTSQDVHVQDVIFLPNNEIPIDTAIKMGIMQYGALDVCYFGQSTYDEANPYYNPDTFAQYVNVTTNANHEVSVVGWDDNFPKERFLITPPGDGAWIIKNSWDTDWGDKGYLYVSYYDKSLSPSTELQNYATGIIIENTEPYNKNYQYDLLWGSKFLLNPTGDNISYYNQFESLDDDLIAAVGTYFNRSGVGYKVEIYVNNQLKLTQEGVSPYIGYRTIKLNEYIPVRKGDVFKAVVTTEGMPFISVAESRVHYTNNISFSCFDAITWDDNFDYNIIACVKVYTVADDSKIINNENITVDYGSKSYFTVQVVTADGHSVGEGAVVKITINGKTTSAITDADGVAKVEIKEVPGSYEVTTAYNGKTYSNTVNVNLNPSTCKITQNKNIKVDYDGGKYFSVKITSQDGKVKAAGVTVKFKINGKTTQAKTDKNGIAKIKITDIPKKYTMTTTYNGKSVKNTVTVNQVLKTKKVTVKKTAKNFSLKASLKINGKLQKGKLITFKFNGKTYKVKTNKKGIAQKTLNKQVIGKLKKGKTYTVKVTYKKDTIKTTVKVK